MQTYKFKIGNVDVNIFTFFDELGNSKQEFIQNVLDKIKEDNEIGFAGWKSKGALKEHLKDKFKEEKISYPKKDLTKESNNLIKNLLKKIPEVLNKNLYIYIFPTDSEFSISKLGGVTGYCIWKNVVYLDVFPNENWQENFKKTLLHEISHSISNYYNMFNLSLGEGLVFDGLAENFVEKILGEPDKKLTNVLSKKEAIKIFNEIKIDLGEKDFDKYGELFYGTGKYPLWTGYSIGYYLIKNYLKEQKEVNWKRLLRKNPNKILEEIKQKVK